MRSRFLSCLILPAALLAAVFNPSAYGAVQDRIAGSVSGGSRVSLPGTVSGRARRSTDLGVAPSDQKLGSLTLRFSMTEAQQADLTQLLAAQLDPSSPSFHQWLTPEEFGARFGVGTGDLAKVSAWLTGQGFSITGTARSSTFINFSGTAGQVQQAFGTAIHSLSLNGEPHISNITDPVLPAAISGVVASITGLNDFRMTPRSRVRNVTIDPAQPRNTQTPGGVVSHFIAPGDLYTIYDFGPLLAAPTPINGTGITIAVMGQTDLTPGNVLPDANVTAFRAASGLPPANLKLQFAGGTDPGVTTRDIDEAHLDVEWSGAAAPGATILYVYGADVFNNSLVYAVDNKVAPIITISYGACESNFNILGSGSTQSPLAANNQVLAMANSLGITVMSSSGDSGAADCDTSDVASEGLNVDFPSSSPYVTSAGGTMFSGDLGSNSATYWNAANGANAGSAIQYIPEQPWNETNAAGGLNAGGSGGGGASAFFAKPSWQVAPGVPADNSRDLPDISLNAAAEHDGYFVCSQGDSATAAEPACTNGFLSANGGANVFGGTSFVGPTFAGILALIEQKLGPSSTTRTGGYGNINPILYGLASGPTYTSIFHDVITGNNSVPCSQGTPNCPNGGSIGFAAGTGYDQASGLGSVDVNALANAWKTATPTGTGGVTPTGVATTSIATTRQLCAVSGTLPLVITITSLTSSTTPTGTVQVLVDNVVVGTAPLTTTSTNGIATASFSLSAATVSSGGHSISAAYLGDGSYTGSKGTLLAANGSLASVDFVSSTKADFSLTPCTGSTAARTGTTAPGVTFTITPINGFTGTVNLAFINNNLAIATPSFTVNPVTVTTSAGVTTSFVIQAFRTVGASQPRPFAQRPSSRVPWYAAGSGATLACMLLLTLPRRRRWTGLLVAVLSVAAIGAVGCSSSTSSTTTGGGGSGGSTPVNSAPAGLYTFTVTAVSNGLIHSAQVTLNVQ